MHVLTSRPKVDFGFLPRGPVVLIGQTSPEGPSAMSDSGSEQAFCGALELLQVGWR